MGDSVREAFEEWYVGDNAIRYHEKFALEVWQAATAHYEDALREVASILTSISSDEGEAFMYSEHARIDKALARLNTIIGDKND